MFSAENGKLLDGIGVKMSEICMARLGMISQHLVLLPPDPEKGESVFAFDNPGFKEGPTILSSAEKIVGNNKMKWPQWNIIPHGSPSKAKTMDDSCIANSAPALTVVPLRSHDFTGLGFNICGNMRDGIFVKDVLHRGPASESGMITAGDRLEAIKINLRHVVLEDALTILSYASPYEVELTLEPRKKENSPSIHPQPPPHILGHPQFVKSHSISDLHKLNKFYEPKRPESASSPYKELNGSFDRRSKNPSPDTTNLTSLDRKTRKQVGSVELPSPSTLEIRVRPTQVLEPERHQNSRNSQLEHNSLHASESSAFTEINLGIDEIDNGSPKESKSPQTNVKSVLVKGIKNLKEKLHNSLLLDDKDDPKGSSRNSTLEKKTAKPPSPKIDDGFSAIDLQVPEEVERAGEVVREKRKSLLEEQIVHDPAPETSDSEDPVAAKRNKRKAPRPPPTDPDAEELPEDQQELRLSLQYSGSRESLKSEDSAASGHNSGTTIELNSSHITVHQAPESESRKASSLGDLSRYEADNVIVLERAVSLDLGDGAPGTKKRKAPLPPQEDGLTPFKEARIETPGTGTLKKSSIWGTLEDVIQNDGSESETDLGISGCSTPENSPDKDEEMVTSTPFKYSPSILSENGISNIEITNSEWEKSDFITAINGDDTPPDLPTSPMPQISSFITEIQVSCPKRLSTTEVIHLDSTEGLLDHMASTMKVEEMEETVTLGPVPQARTGKRSSTPVTPSPPTKSPASERQIKPLSPSLKGNVTVTSIKGQSRIPVRAGPRSPGSTLSPSSKRSSSAQRNGHSSP
uniref:PDZ domain-containing protein n=4 Tax=Lygus hesperus TaxID=30085 RepID=A0A146LBQ0_LYGHE